MYNVGIVRYCLFSKRYRGFSSFNLSKETGRAGLSSERRAGLPVNDHVTANNFLRGCSALKIKHGRRNCGFMVFLLREVEKLRYIRIITKAL